MELGWNETSVKRDRLALTVMMLLSGIAWSSPCRDFLQSTSARCRNRAQCTQLLLDVTDESTKVSGSALGFSKFLASCANCCQQILERLQREVVFFILLGVASFVRLCFALGRQVAEDVHDVRAVIHVGYTIHVQTLDASARIVTATWSGQALPSRRR